MSDSSANPSASEQPGKPTVAVRHFHLSDATEWEPWLAGSVRYLRRPGVDGDEVEAALWRGTQADIPPGTKVRYDRDELLYLISGRLKLEVEGGPVLELAPGDAASFRAGSIVRWTLLTDAIEEFFVYLPKSRTTEPTER